jgi:hypothetical protein
MAFLVTPPARMMPLAATNLDFSLFLDSSQHGEKVRATDCYGGDDTCSEDFQDGQTESWVLQRLANLPPKNDKELDYGGCG